MKIRNIWKMDTDCFSTRHQKSWHSVQLGVGEHLHFWICRSHNSVGIVVSASYCPVWVCFTIG